MRQDIDVAIVLSMARIFSQFEIFRIALPAFAHELCYIFGVAQHLVGSSCEVKYRWQLHGLQCFPVVEAIGAYPFSAVYPAVYLPVKLRRLVVAAHANRFCRKVALVPGAQLSKCCPHKIDHKQATQGENADAPLRCKENRRAELLNVAVARHPSQEQHATPGVGSQVDRLVGMDAADVANIDIDVAAYEVKLAVDKTFFDFGLALPFASHIGGKHVEAICRKVGGKTLTTAAMKDAGILDAAVNEQYRAVTSVAAKPVHRRAHAL